MMTNKKRTATAPTQIIISAIAKNSAFDNKNSIEVLKKTNIKNKTECIGFFKVITSKEEITIISDVIKNKKIVKITLLKKIYLYFESNSNLFLISFSHISPFFKSFSLLKSNSDLVSVENSKFGPSTIASVGQDSSHNPQ